MYIIMSTFSISELIFICVIFRGITECFVLYQDDRSKQSHLQYDKMKKKKVHSNRKRNVLVESCQIDLHF